MFLCLAVRIHVRYLMRIRYPAGIQVVCVLSCLTWCVKGAMPECLCSVSVCLSLASVFNYGSRFLCVCILPPVCLYLAVHFSCVSQCPCVFSCLRYYQAVHRSVCLGVYVSSCPCFCASSSLCAILGCLFSSESLFVCLRESKLFLAARVCPAASWLMWSCYPCICVKVILVVDDEARDSLPEELSFGLVLTIFESKGLEFDDVLLYNFFKDSTVSA